MDEHLAHFTTVEAAQLRRLVGASFARAGRDVAVHASHVGGPDGNHVRPPEHRGSLPRRRPERVARRDRRSRAQVTTQRRGLGELSPEELEAGLYLHLAETGSLADPDELGYARQVAPRLLEVLSVYLPDSVATLRKEDLAALGRLDELVELGRANLRALLSATTSR